MTASQALWDLNSEDNRAAEKKGKMGPGWIGTLTPSKAPRMSVPFHSTVQSSSYLLSTYYVLGAEGCTDKHV